MTNESTVHIEFNKLSLSPGVQAVQKQALAAVVIGSQLDSAGFYNFSNQYKQIASAANQVIRPLADLHSYTNRISTQMLPIVETIHSTVSSYVAIQDTINHMNLISRNLSEIVGATTGMLSRTVSGLRNLQMISVQTIADTLKQVGPYNLASSFKHIDLTLDVNFDELPVREAVNPYDELSPQEINEKLKKEIERDKEILGVNVPYNVLGMGFIKDVYLPVTGMAYSLEASGAIDASFAVQFFIFAILPFVLNLSTKNNTSTKEEIKLDVRIKSDDGENI
ncbi:hypothetical protein CIL03_08800 [Virgibacillus indicus]|uniref:Uncharacterized protein n=1 Tax=Virgibacillus indicus TaxID=2024554 RepID=A0A265NAN6_9BACI|nr:hypothetical protein [Virgibacillus indicus]OZU89100.1 hypothetical protein CIL03_08800 [Virgibacillus indicus]